MENWQENGFAVYLHWPFCQAKCPYCDFNSHVAQFIDQDRWRASFLSDIDRWADRLPGRLVRSIYFGGGTPSLMPEGTVAAILDRLAARWPLANDVEITLEANPGSVEAGRFAGYRAAGVNRVSLGLQALNDSDLRRLGRLHSAAEGRAALEIAKAHFERVSFDLIYARQDQSLEDWRAELARALEMAAGHLSLYQLTIEPGTAFAARFDKGGLKGLPDEDLGAEMYELTQEMTAAAGLPAYEISNHAAVGLESRHNRVYWQGGDWVGIGPGAHGRLTLDGRRRATEAPAQPGKWLAAVDDSAVDTETPIAPGEAIEEKVMMGLRLREGIPQDLLGRLPGNPLETLGNLASDGLVERSGPNWRATMRGRLLLNAVLRELLA